MIEFEFTIGISFKNFRRHPITIPTRNNESLDAKEKDKLEGLKIIAPSGGSLNGRIYHGHSSFGPYFQIHTRGGHPCDPFMGLAVGEKVIVRLHEDDGIIEIMAGDGKGTPF